MKYQSFYPYEETMKVLNKKEDELVDKAYDLSEDLIGEMKDLNPKYTDPHYIADMCRDFLKKFDAIEDEYRETMEHEEKAFNANRDGEYVLLGSDDDDEPYIPSATYGDYSPSCPWNAPGMSVSDFI